MLSILKKVKNGAFLRVVIQDQHGNVHTTQLHYNTLGRKFYISKDKRGLQRKVITGKEAARLVFKTWQLKEYAKSRKVKEAGEANEAEGSTKPLS